MLIVLAYNIQKLFRIIEGKTRMDYWVVPNDLKPEIPKTFKKKKKKTKISGNAKLKMNTNTKEKGAVKLLVS